MKALRGECNEVGCPHECQSHPYGRRRLEGLSCLPMSLVNREMWMEAGSNSDEEWK